MDRVQRMLGSEIGFPVLILVMNTSGLKVMGLANYAREAAPAWHGPMRLFLFMMIGLALRDLIRARRARLALAERINTLHPSGWGK
jgi:hypothetical protein